jgi:hypothetical protein
VPWHSSDYRVDSANYAGLHGDRRLRAACKDESAALTPISCGYGKSVIPRLLEHAADHQLLKTAATVPVIEILLHDYAR